MGAQVTDSKSHLASYLVTFVLLCGPGVQISQDSPDYYLFSAVCTYVYVLGGVGKEEGK